MAGYPVQLWSERVNVPARQPQPEATTKAGDSEPTRLSILGQFRLFVNGAPIKLTGPSQRLLALLGTDSTGTMRRTQVAGTLWPESTETAALSNLRSALSRLGSLRGRVVEATFDSVRLGSGVVVDLAQRRTDAQRLLGPSCDITDLSPAHFADDLLPAWSDLWLEPEREAYRQLRLHALEVLGDRLVRAGQFGQAIEAGLMAVAAAPLRESAHRALINAFAAEGNRGEALYRYNFLRDLLEEELGIEPSFTLQDVLAE